MWDIHPDSSSPKSASRAAQGEFTGVAMIRAYHDANGDTERNEILVPDAAHGTNPATATMCGYKVREIPTGRDGDVDLEALKGAVGPQTAGIMLTNPSTLGVFERRIKEIAALIHELAAVVKTGDVEHLERVLPLDDGGHRRRPAPVAGQAQGEPDGQCHCRQAAAAPDSAPAHGSSSFLAIPRRRRAVSRHDPPPTRRRCR